MHATIVPQKKKKPAMELEKTYFQKMSVKSIHLNGSTSTVKLGNMRKPGEPYVSFGWKRCVVHG